MKFTLANIVCLVETAVGGVPPPVISGICGEYYSPYYYLFYLLAWTCRGGVAVELGVEQGRGSACLAAGSRGVQVYGFDHTRRDEVGEFQKRYPNFTFIQQPSLPPDLDKFQRPVNILHVDTEHSYSMAGEEFRAYQPYLAEGAVVLFDDLHAQGDGVLKFFMELPYPKIQDDRLHPVCGYGVLVCEKNTEAGGQLD